MIANGALSDAAPLMRMSRNMSIFRAAQTRRSPWMPLILVVVYGLLTVAAFSWTAATNGLATLWLGNGLVAAALLLLPRSPALALLAAAAVMDFACAVTIGRNAPPQGVLIALIDLSETVAVAFLARRVGGAALDVTRPRRLLSIVGLAVLPAALAAGTAGAAISHLLFGADLIPLWLAWAGGDVLGMTIALPATLLIARPRRFALATPLSAGRFGIIVAIWALTALVFWQDAVHALTLAVLMAVLLSTFVMSPACVAATNVGVAFIATALTLSGQGPISADSDDLGTRVLHLQLFVAIIVFTSLVAQALIAERARSQRSLTRTLSAVREAHRKADAAAAAKARFLATMSHEMRTPLNGVMGHVQLLEARGDLSPDARSHLAGVRIGTETLACLIDDVLDFSQLDTGPLQLDLASVEIGAIAEQVGAMGRQLIGARPLKLTVDRSGAAAIRHRLDGRRVSQVLLHLVSNAVKFTPAGNIHITAEVTRGADGMDLCRLEVQDSGIGISPEHRDLIFAPFTQVDGSTTRRHGGAGLGLTICRALVSLMGGRIGFDSPPTGGSLFWIEISAQREADAGETPLAPGQVRVLVVDDHPANRDVATALLQALGCSVATCDDGSAAVRAVQSEPYDLVFMDIHMPGMDGIEACRAIRSLPHAVRDTPIVALTAASTSADVAACLGAGMNGHLSKPIRADRLAEAIVRHIA